MRNIFWIMLGLILSTGFYLMFGYSTNSTIWNFRMMILYAFLGMICIVSIIVIASNDIKLGGEVRNFFYSIIIFLGGMITYKWVHFLFARRYFSMIDVLKDGITAQYFDLIYYLYLFITGLISLSCFYLIFFKIGFFLLRSFKKRKLNIVIWSVLGFEFVFEFFLRFIYDRYSILLFYHTISWIPLIFHIILTFLFSGLLIYVPKSDKNQKIYTIFIVIGLILVIFTSFPFHFAEHFNSPLFSALSSVGVGCLFIGSYFTTLVPLPFQNKEIKPLDEELSQEKNH